MTLSKKRAALHGTMCPKCRHEINAYYEACPSPVFHSETTTVLPCNCVCIERTKKSGRTEKQR
jgi:hypothetical protein